MREKQDKIAEIGLFLETHKLRINQYEFVNYQITILQIT